MIALNSLLLAIWVLRETIALRNTLLVIGFLLSIVYVIRLSKDQPWNLAYRKFPLWLPVILIAILFIWVIFHYFFLSMNPVTQLQELKSTWFRAFLAWVTGSVCGIAIIRLPKKFAWLAFGLLSNFLGLFIEYIPLAFAQGRLTNVMPVLENYLQGKIYAVLLGVVYFGGILGLIAKKIAGKEQGSWRQISYWALALFPIFYSYIFIVDTRNGVGVSVLVYFFWLVWAIIYLKNNLSFIKKYFSVWKFFLALFISTVFIIGAAKLQSSQNKGWGTTFEDAVIAVQIERYQNWQNPPVLGYPLGIHAGNTYERAAWFVAAISMVPDRLWGDGTLKHAFGRVTKERYPLSNLTTSHSPWLDFTLSFGAPGIFCLLGSFLLTLFLSFRVHGSLIHYVRWIALAILLTYSFAELFNQVSFEMLIYCSGLLPCLLLGSTFESTFKSERH